MNCTEVIVQEQCFVLVESPVPFVSISSGSTTEPETETFESVSKNVRTWDYTIQRTGSDITSITYSKGVETVVKTFGYTGADLTSLTLSGDTPFGILLVKTLTYTNDELTGVSYT